MKTLQINLAIASLFMIASISVQAQSNKTKDASTKQRAEVKQEIKLLNEIPTSKRTVTVSQSTPIVNAKRDGNKRVSEYLSMEKVIIERLISGEIPTSFPKHVTGQTKEQYIEVIKSWGKNNLNLIKKEYHKDLLSRPTPIKE